MVTLEEGIMNKSAFLFAVATLLYDTDVVCRYVALPAIEAEWLQVPYVLSTLRFRYPELVAHCAEQEHGTYATSLSRRRES
jgi:hypothetical protein